MDVKEALDLPMVDYEDAVVASIAEREKVDFIITRNTKDFLESPVPAIIPDDYLTILDLSANLLSSDFRGIFSTGF